VHRGENFLAIFLARFFVEYRERFGLDLEYERSRARSRPWQRYLAAERFNAYFVIVRQCAEEPCFVDKDPKVAL